MSLNKKHRLHFEAQPGQIVKNSTDLTINITFTFPKSFFYQIALCFLHTSMN